MIVEPSPIGSRKPPQARLPGLHALIEQGHYFVIHAARQSGKTTLILDLEHERYVIELKIRYGEKTEEEGLGQLLQYMDTLAVAEGWLLLFDRRPEIPWDQKVFNKEVKRGAKTIHIFGC